MTDLTKVEAEYKQVKEDIKKIGDQLKSYAEKAEDQIKKHSDMNADTKQKVDESLVKFNELNARINDLTQKLQRPLEERQETNQSLGQIVINSEAFKNSNVDASYRGNLRVTAPRAAITTAEANVVQADRQSGIIAGPERKMTIRNLLAPGNTSSNSVEYVRETGFTNNASTVEEGKTKPYSEIQTELTPSAVRTIAHLFKASRQILEDLPGLASFIDARARYGLLLEEERQLLYGNGSGPNLLGIVPQASTFQINPSIKVEKSTAIDRIRLALLQAVLAEYPASGIVLNPIDWAAIELTKDGEGRYLIGNATEGTIPKLWKLPVVETQAMVANQFLVGAFNIAAQIFDRMLIEVLISTENDKDFEQNMISIRAEERLALTVHRPEAFVTGAVNE